jgi:hypothetical protein
LSALAPVLALIMGAAGAVAGVPAQPHATPAEIAEAKRLLAADGYSDIAVLSSEDQLVTASAMKDGRKRVVDVDPTTAIILPHVDLPPLPTGLAPVAGLAARPR